MLSKFLAYLKKGGNANISTISKKLDIDEGTVVMLFDQLVKLGYLEEIDTNKKIDINCLSKECKKCSHTISCDDLLKVRYRLIK